MTATSNIASKVSAPCYAYTAYGLRIQSPFALPFQRLDTVDAANANVRIRLGTAPARLPGRPRNQAHDIWESVPGALLLRMEGVARFFVSNGTDVVVEPESGSEHEIAAAMARQAPMMAARHPAEPSLLDALTSRIEAHLDSDATTAVAAG